MDEVLELAEKLSTAIARSSRYQDLREAEKAVMVDEEAVRVIQQREAAAKVVIEKEAKGEPVEPAEKRALAEAEETLRTNVTLSTLGRTQADFQEMLNLVNDRITSAIRPEKPEAEAAPTEETSEAETPPAE